MKLTHASVFSGIGGPEVAAAMLGWDNLFHCEINPFGRAVLEYWFPNATSYEDITKTDFSEWRGKVNVLTGGFPCQPFSYAGQRRGEKDDRYLWPYMHRCINQVRPDWVVCENVGGILTMVEQGSVTDMAVEKSLFGEVDTLHRYRLTETFTLERICNDLEGDGYAVQAVIIPACAVGAPHRRDRVFIIGCRNDVADTTLMHINGGITGDGCNDRRQPQPEFGSRDCTADERGNVPDPIRKGLEGQDQPRCGETGQRVHLRRDPARCHRQDDEERATAADTNGNGQPTPSRPCGRERAKMDAGRTDKPFDGAERPCTARPATHPDCNRRREMDEHLQPRLADGSKPVSNGGQRNVADTERERLLSSEHIGQSRLGERLSSWCGCRTLREGAIRSEADGICGQRWQDFPSVSPVHRGNDGIPFPLDNLTISPSKWRTESLKAYGNAIVPQVMYEIFRAIESTYDTRH